MADEKILLDEIGKLSKNIEDKNTEHTAKMLEFKTASDKQIKELNDALETKDKKFTDLEKQVNEDMAKKGATLEEIGKELKELKAAKGRFKGGTEYEKKSSDFIAEAFKEHFDQIGAISKNKPVQFELKAVGNMTTAASLTGNAVATYDLTPQVRGFRKVNIRDLVPVINSATGTWKFYQENVGQPADGSFTQQLTHGAAKSQVDYTLTEKTVNAEYFAAYVRFAKQMATDLPFLQTYVAQALMEDFRRGESALYFGTLTAGATGDTTASGITTTLIAELYIQWIANLMANDYAASAIVTSATNWGKVLRTKPNDYSIPGGITIDTNGIVRFAGIPLIVQNNIAANKSLIGDFSRAAIVQTEGVSLEFFEQDQDNVIKNLITARCEARTGFAILRPDAFIYGTNT